MDSTQIHILYGSLDFSSGKNLYLSGEFYLRESMANHNDKGKWGERIAAEYLIAQGYAVCETNWRVPPYEIDIVAMKGGRIVFVEVKTRKNDFIDPAMAVTKSKQSYLVRAANAYMAKSKLPHEVQFDIVIIVGDEKNYTLEHIPDAFYPPLKTYR